MLTFRLWIRNEVPIVIGNSKLVFAERLCPCECFEPVIGRTRSILMPIVQKHVYAGVTIVNHHTDNVAVWRHHSGSLAHSKPYSLFMSSAQVAQRKRGEHKHCWTSQRWHPTSTITSRRQVPDVLVAGRCRAPCHGISCTTPWPPTYRRSRECSDGRPWLCRCRTDRPFP